MIYNMGCLNKNKNLLFSDFACYAGHDRVDWSPIMLYVHFHDLGYGISWFNGVVGIDPDSGLLRRQTVGY